MLVDGEIDLVSRDGERQTPNQHRPAELRPELRRPSPFWHLRFHLFTCIFSIQKETSIRVIITITLGTLMFYEGVE